MNKVRFGVVGAGAWGTALAQIIACKGEPVTIWCMEEKVARQINKKKENKVFLPKVKLSANISATNSIEDACKDKEILLFVVPAQHTRRILNTAKPFINNKTILVCASKGIEVDTLELFSDIFKEILPPNPVCFISGPSFAHDVAHHLPAGISVACRDEKVAEKVQREISLPFFKLYTTTDVRGVEIGGAVKNVIAIAAGVLTGMGLGSSSLASMVTRGIHEMTRLGVKLGANPMTFAGLSGIGDLILTCYGELSRNRSLGLELASGKPLTKILKKRKTVAEGITTAKAVHDLAKKLGLDLPISEQVYEMLYEGKNPIDAIRTLASRGLKSELDGIEVD